MSNTNSQTILQMQGIVNKMVQQATGRESVGNIDMDFVTVAQDQRTISKTVDYDDVIEFTNNSQIPLKIDAEMTYTQAGEGDPAPDNVRPVTGWTGVKVTRCGKNLLTGNKWKNGNNVYLGQSQSGYPVLLKPAKYTISVKTTVAVDIYQEASNGVGGRLTRATQKNPVVTFTIETEGYYQLWAYASGLNVENITEYQLERGETATAYEPYDGDTYTITFPETAGTVYGGVLHVDTGKLAVNRVGLVLDSSVAFFASGDYPGSFYKNRNAFTPAIPDPATVEIICSHAKRVPTLSQETYTIGCMYIDGSVNLRLLGTDATLEDWNTYVDAQKTNGTPVTLVYTIDTPIIYNLTPTEVKSLIGYNTVFADCGEVSVTYTSLVPVP